MSEELNKKLLEYSERSDDTPDTRGYDLALVEHISWFVENVWNDVSVRPKYDADSPTRNQILVYGKTKLGVSVSCSIANVLEDGKIYAPISCRTYKWGECPFKKWAYVTDLIPSRKDED